MNFENEKKQLREYIDENVRTLYTDERTLNKFQINEKLLFVTNSLWTHFQELIGPMRKKIQDLESQVLVNRYNLDETLKKHCKSKVDFKRAEYELGKVEENIDSHRNEMLRIENYCNDDEAEGDLKRLPMWVFFVLMTVVGFAEIVVYFNVFLSQEIGLMSDLDSNWEKIKYYIFAGMMATGFTVMLIWLSHKLGMMLRQYTSIHKKIRFAYWLKFTIIFVVVLSAIWATVNIRGKMHQILDKEHRIEVVRDGDDSIASMSMAMDDDNSMTMNDDSGTMDDDVGMTDDSAMSMDDATDNTKTASSVRQTKEMNKLEPETESSLRNAINMMKGDLAQLFIIINLFIVVAGIFLSYEVHTSNVKYEALEGMINRLEKRRKKLLKIKEKSEKDLLKNEKGELLSILKQYVESVNKFDEYSQIIKTFRISIENVYIEMVYYMFGTMQEHNLLADLDEKYLEQFSPEYLSERFTKEWKLEQVDIAVVEVMHINNLDEFIESFQCRSSKVNQVQIEDKVIENADEAEEVQNSLEKNDKDNSDV